MEPIDILYYSCPYDLSGYGTVSRNHLLRMMDYKDLNVRLRLKKFWTGVAPDLGKDKDKLQSLERTPISNNNFIFIQHLTPENFFIDPRAKYHIAYTPFETDGAPIPWLLPLRGVDEVWVPSTNNKNAYTSVGINPDKIHVIPHGVDTEVYNPDVKPLIYNHGGFNFGSVFDWTERKNPVALIRAYYNAFYRGEDVTLTIRTFWRFPIEQSKEYINSEVEKIKEGYGGRSSFPKILFWFDTMEASMMPSFYKSLDSFVLPTRGEGFGLPFLEAMACGVPTIGPSWGGNTEFMKDDNCILVGGNLKEIDHHKFLTRHPQYNGQRWFDVNEDELSSSMRWMYVNRKDSKKMADKALKDVQENWTWDNTVGKIYKRLLELNEILNPTNVIK